jgi:thiol:disulfide interchange protein DsbC
MLKRIFTLSSLILISYATYADTPTVDSMQKMLSKAVPEIKVENVKPTPVKGFYEVTSGPSIFYVSEDGKFLFYGELFEIKNDTITSITEQTRQAAVKAELAKIDPKTFIVFPASDKEKAVITIGTDIDCGYCRKLHEEIPALNAAGITVRYIAFPRTPKGTPSYEKSAAIWCSKDPKATLDSVLKGGTPPEKPAECQDPFAEHTAFIRSIGASATPIIILQNGTVIPGYMPASDLIALVLKAE